MPRTAEQKRAARAAKKALVVRDQVEGITADFIVQLVPVLAEVADAYSANEIRGKIMTLNAWAKNRGASVEIVGNGARAKFLTEVRIGELCNEMAKAQGKRSDKLTDGTSISTKKSQLEQAGLTEKQASRWGRWAKMTENARAKIGNSIVARAVRSVGDKTSHMARNTGEFEWYTPDSILDIARAAMGGIDLDPASCEIANRRVKAKRFFTAADDGLVKEWSGRVWMNPPFRIGLVDRFATKIVEEYGAGRVKQACVLVNNTIDCNWCQAMLKAATCVCLISGRVRFVDKDGEAGSPLQGQILVYFGNAPKRFQKAARDLGVCCAIMR